MNKVFLSIIVACLVVMTAPVSVSAKCKNKTHKKLRNSKNNYQCPRMSLQYYKNSGRKEKYLAAFYDGLNCTLCGCVTTEHSDARRANKRITK
jgi:hypothetical protein